jgi:hypothetical protein
MTLIKVERDLAWLPRGSEARLLLTSDLPPPQLITSVHVFAFEGDKLLITHLRDRHWDIPRGGGGCAFRYS